MSVEELLFLFLFFFKLIFLIILIISFSIRGLVHSSGWLASYSCHKSVVVENLCLQVGCTLHSVGELGIHVGDEQQMIVS